MGYYITIKNNLLEAKHVEAMGSSVWLYMWLIDKVMAINENGIGKVLNGRPVTYERIEKDLGISRATYKRWIKLLEEAKYIRTIRAPYGLVIYVNKAAKMWGQRSQANNASLFDEKRSVKNEPSDLKKGTKKSKSRTKMSHLDSSNVSHQSNENEPSNNNNNTYKYSKDNIGDLKFAEYKKIIGSLYYQVIEKLDVPVRNNNNVEKAIIKMSRLKDRQKTVNYLNFLMKGYLKVDWKYKPRITEALHIHDKRASIRETFVDHLKSNKNGNVEVI